MMSFHFFKYFITGKCIIFIFHFHEKSTRTVCPDLQRNVRVSGSDELLVSDADASALKRITVDNLISSAGGLTAVVADTSPELGGDLDVLARDIVSSSNRNS